MSEPIYNDEEASLLLMEAKGLLTNGNDDMNDELFDKGMAIITRVEDYLERGPHE